VQPLDIKRKRQHSERVNIMIVQSFRLVSTVRHYPRVALRLTPGYYDIVFQTIARFEKNSILPNNGLIIFSLLLNIV
jgi:hypothetical protein